MRNFADADNRCALGNGAEIQQFEELQVELVPFAITDLSSEVVELTAEACSHHIAVEAEILSLG